MKTIVYKLPPVEKPIPDNKIVPLYDTSRPTKLIKLGFNQPDYELNVIEITSDPHYTAGLNYDFTRMKDKDISKDFFPTTAHAEFWEIISSFDLLKENSVVSTTHSEVLLNIVNRYEKITQKTYNIKINVSGPVDLTIYRYIDIDSPVDETISVPLIIKGLSGQKPGSHTAIQLCGIQTTVILEIIFYLASKYESSFLFRPDATSNISGSSYIVCTGLRETYAFPDVFTEKSYLIKVLSNTINIPDMFVSYVQCFNSELIPRKLLSYNRIKKYLNGKVYEGITYQEMIKEQDENIEKWVSMYIKDFKNIQSRTAEKMEKSVQQCSRASKLDSLLDQ